MLWALVLGILSIGISLTLKISAQTTTTTTTTTTSVTCSYETSEWSKCSQTGIMTRTVKAIPIGCIPDTDNLPDKEKTCTYVPETTATACTYTYSSWSDCNIYGKRTRTIASRTPSGCIDMSTPILSESCTYVAPTTTTRTTSSETTATSTACTYTLSDWSTCKSSGIQTRDILSRAPSGCYDSSMPILQRTCTFTTSTTSSTGTTTTNTSSDSSVACSYYYSDWGVCDSSGKQRRVVTGKYPLGCTESAVSYVERSCSYAATTTTAGTGIACAYVLSEWSVCNADGKQTRLITSKTPYGCSDYNVPELSRYCTAATSVSSTPTVSGTTPEFNFLNINGGEVFSETVKIEGTVPNAYSVEFNLVPTDSNMPKYLGFAKRNSNNIWEYSFNSDTQPNGSYYLKAKVKNAYGSYDGGQRMIVILNSANDENTAATSESTTAPIAPPSTNASGTIDQTNSEWQNKYFKSENCIDQNICGGMADPDKDGLNNNDEYRYGTNPTNPDTDKDGFLDGDEIKSGFNPLKAAPGDKSDKIVFESPKESGEIKSDLYEVTNVEVSKNEEGENNLKISGRGIPNSFVTVYVYSDPIIFTIKTDSDGNWSYVLDKDVEDGEHQVYVAVTDNAGKITGKSTAMGFVKTAQAVNIIPPAEAASSANAISPTSRWYQKDFFLLISLTLAGLALALASIGLVRHHMAIRKIESQK